MFLLIFHVHRPNLPPKYLLPPPYEFQEISDRKREVNNFFQKNFERGKIIFSRFRALIKIFLPIIWADKAPPISSLAHARARVIYETYIVCILCREYIDKYKISISNL